MRRRAKQIPKTEEITEQQHEEEATDSVLCKENSMKEAVVAYSITVPISSFNSSGWRPNCSGCVASERPRSSLHSVSKCQLSLAKFCIGDRSDGPSQPHIPGGGGVMGEWLVARGCWINGERRGASFASRDEVQNLSNQRATPFRPLPKRLRSTGPACPCLATQSWQSCR